MAVRIRKDGQIFCAALSKALDGDCYIDDDLHYELASERKILVTTEYEYHIKNGGEWWWRGQEPSDVPINKIYRENNCG